MKHYYVNYCTTIYVYVIILFMGALVTHFISEAKASTHDDDEVALLQRFFFLSVFF